ncbi:two-component system phosphate regulon sensor histidine kinase PhoR [Dysgonomonadaceae bacterium PH5-43]|nr:two-component system phosphate regulon sensor histidine kinase PhoR [Dysgonomonadaceae bacterium PH5-43]
MKKSAIWLLVGVMVFAFTGLLYLQTNYIRIILTTQEDQFKEAVRRSLYQVSRNLELDEAGQLLLGKYSYYGQNKSTNAITKGLSGSVDFSVNVDSLPDIVPGFGKSDTRTSAKTIKDFQDDFLYAQNMVEELMIRSRKGYERPIGERIDYQKLETYIQSELTNNNMAIPFSFMVMDKDKNVVYKSPDYNLENKKNVYSQILFPKDPANKLYTLLVAFPTQNKYVLNSISFIIPSVLFTVVLLVVFLFTVYIIFRQRRLSEIKTDFINNMTHELKTPVASISLAAQTMNDADVNNSPRLMEHAKKVINDESKRLGFLVEKVLQMSLFEDRAIEFKMAKLDVNDLITSIASTFALRVENTGGTLDIDLEALESTIVVDKMHFTNVLFNLMENAVKYRRQDVPLELMIRTLNVGEKVQVRIEDNGTGIRKESLKKIFDRFYRVPTGNRHDVKGFGLGLAYVKRIITELGGTIKAESEYGEGTTFIISIPYI